MEHDAPQKIAFGKDSIKFNSTKTWNYLQNTLNINLLEISRAKALKLISKRLQKQTWILDHFHKLISLNFTASHICTKPAYVSNLFVDICVVFMCIVYIQFVYVYYMFIYTYLYLLIYVCAFMKCEMHIVVFYQQ